MILQRYSKSFNIRYLETNAYKEATPIAIVNLMQETAFSHSELVGLGIDDLKALGVAWILNRWGLKMECYPSLNNQVIVETWPTDLDKFYAIREFLIKSPEGKIYGRGTSRWIYYNIEKKRPVRIPPHYAELYGLEHDKALDYCFEDLKISEDLNLKSELLVRRSDIDTNNHVNNCKYIEWVLEVIPRSVYESYQLSFLEIAYKKEINNGSVICYSNDCNETDPIQWEGLHRVTDKEGTELTTAKTVWIKRC